MNSSTRSGIQGRIFCRIICLTAAFSWISCLHAESWQRKENFATSPEHSSKGVLWGAVTDPWSYYVAQPGTDKQLSRIKPMVWDESWYGQTRGLWARGDDLAPSISEKQITLQLNQDTSSFAAVVRWKNTSGHSVRAVISGRITANWGYLKDSFPEPESWPQAGFFVALTDATGGVSGQPLMDKMFSRTKDSPAHAELELEAQVPADGSIVFVYYREPEGEAKGGWVGFEDAVIITTD